MRLCKTGYFLFVPLFSLFLMNCAGTRTKETDTLQFIKIEEELRLNEELQSFTTRYLAIIRNRQIDQFLTEMANHIGAVSHWRGLNYSVFVINEPDINHFSLPGGTIYIFRGLIEQTHNADEIAAILAHEIVHLSQRDAVARLAEKYSYAFAAQQVIGENPEIAEHVIMSLYRNGTILDYSAEQEKNADKVCLSYMLDAGYDPRSMISLLEKMINKEKENPRLFELLRMTHAASAPRLRRVKKSIKKLSIDPAAFRNDTRDFAKLKDTLAKIPQ